MTNLMIAVFSIYMAIMLFSKIAYWWLERTMCHTHNCGWKQWNADGNNTCSDL